MLLEFPLEPFRTRWLNTMVSHLKKKRMTPMKNLNTYKTLKPLQDKPEDYANLEEAILEVFKEEIYLPILKLLGEKKAKLENSTDDLIRAIRSGRVKHFRGHFIGKYSSTLTRELRGLGAKWDRKHGSWKIPLSKLPVEVRDEITSSEAKFKESLRKVSTLLEDMDHEKLAVKVPFDKLFDTTLYKLNKRFKDSVLGLGVVPEMTPKLKEALSEEYVKNLKTAIADFTRKETSQLREKIQDMYLKGHRYDTLVEKIQRSYGVSTNKAHFLARQETNLVTAKYRETRFKEAGVDKYIWRCVVGSPNHPVRPLHKKNDGKIYSWDKPPVVNDLGDRKHPGEDFNCRCIAIPVVEF